MPDKPDNDDAPDLWKDLGKPADNSTPADDKSTGEGNDSLGKATPGQGGQKPGAMQPRGRRRQQPQQPQLPVGSPSGMGDTRDVLGKRGAGSPEAGQNIRNQVKQQAADTAFKAAGNSVAGPVGGKIASEFGRGMPGTGASDEDKQKFKRRVIFGAITAYLVPMLIMIISFVFIALAVTAVSKSFVGSAAADASCKLDSVASFAGFKDKSEWCQHLDDIKAALSDKDIQILQQNASLIQNALDCTNATRQEQANGECIEGLIDYGEENQSVVPLRATWMVPVWKQAAEKYDIPWEALAAVNGARTNFGYVNCMPGHRDEAGTGYYRQDLEQLRKYSVDGGHAKTKKASGFCYESKDPAEIYSNEKIDKITDSDKKSISRYDGVDATFTVARMLANEGARGKSKWNYNGSSANSCTTEARDGRFFIVPDITAGPGTGALGYNENLDIPRDIVMLAAKYRGSKKPMPREVVHKLLVAAWVAFGVSEEVAERNANLNIERIEQESSFINDNPNLDVANDVNARNGTPSNGLLHFIPSTFEGAKVSGFNDRLNPLDSILALVNVQVNGSISHGKTVNGILTRGDWWGPGAWKNGKNPYATGGRATVVDEVDPYKDKNKDKEDPEKFVKYKGDKATDVVSKAIRHYNEDYGMSDCYLAQVNAWYQSLVENPPKEGSEFTADASTVRGKIVQIARQEAELGLKERGVNCGPPLDKYWGKGVCGGNSTPWCAMFSTWVYKEAGLKIDYGSYSTKPNQAAYSGAPAIWASKRGQWHPASSSYKGQPGDSAIWGPDPVAGGFSAHISIVIRQNSNGSLATVGGNEADTVLYQPNRPRKSGSPLAGIVEVVKGNPAAEGGSSKKTGPLLTADERESFDKLIQGMPGRQGIAVSALGKNQQVYKAGDFTSGIAWSTSKVPVAMAAISAKTARSADLSSAITVSDNAAAERLFAGIGTPAKAASASTAQLRAVGDSKTVIRSQRIRSGYTAFGQTTWGITDQTRAVAGMKCTASGRKVLGLMEQTTSSQKWGLGTIGTTPAIKGGWGPGTTAGKADGWLERQMGVVYINDKPVAISIASTGGSHESATANLDKIADWAKTNVNTSSVSDNPKC